MHDARPISTPALIRPLAWVAGGVAIIGIIWALNQGGWLPGLAGALANPERSLISLSTIFLGIFIEAVPFVLLGVLVSSALHLFVDEARLRRWLPRQPLLASLTGSLLGLFFPVCECGVVPVSRRLMQKGASLPLGISFLLAAPVINPVVIISTWVAFGGDWGMVLGRVGLTLLIASSIGLLFGLHPYPQRLLIEATDGPPTPGPDHDDQPPEMHHPTHHAQSPAEGLRALLWHSGAEFVEMSRYLILGALLAALLQTFVPRATLLALGSSPVMATLVMIGLAVVLSICSTVDAFIALSFAGTFSNGALLAFLVFGPMVDVKSTLMFVSIFPRRAVAGMILLVFQMVLLASLFISYTWG